MMGVADALERTAELVAREEMGLAPALSAMAAGSCAFVDAKDAFLKVTGFSTLGDYVARRGGHRAIVAEDLRRAAAIHRNGGAR
jgi:hypothetical protein